VGRSCTSGGTLWPARHRNAVFTIWFDEFHRSCRLRHRAISHEVVCFHHHHNISFHHFHSFQCFVLQFIITNTFISFHIHLFFLMFFNNFIFIIIISSRTFSHHILHSIFNSSFHHHSFIIIIHHQHTVPRDPHGDPKKKEGKKNVNSGGPVVNSSFLSCHLLLFLPRAGTTFPI